MSTENFKIQIRKGLLEFCVLQIISRNEVYTSDIIEELKKLHEHDDIDGDSEYLENKLNEAISKGDQDAIEFLNMIKGASPP